MTSTCTLTTLSVPRLRIARYRAYWSLGCAVAAAWALGFPLLSHLGTERLWGLCAAVGYGAGALAALTLPRRRVSPAVVGLALAGAVVVPLGALLAQGLGQTEVTVVQNSAVSLLHSGAVYVPHPRTVLDYDPYLPGMALFGLPHALLGGLPVLGDVRVWFLAAFAGCLALAWRLRPGTPGLAVALGAVIASPLVAVQAVVGGVDLPIIGLCCLALALAERGRAGWAGIALAAACSLKWTAWPALPVVLVLLAQVHGARAVRRCAAVATAGTALVVLPAVLAQPGAVLQQVLRFPLGLAPVHTPADSPLPGHLLAATGPAGRAVALALLVAGCLAVIGWLALRPPRTAVSAADRLALGLALAFLLAPAGRFGYLQLPAVLVVWPRLLRGPSAALPVVPAREPAAVVAER